MKTKVKDTVTWETGQTWRCGNTPDYYAIVFEVQKFIPDEKHHPRICKVLGMTVEECTTRAKLIAEAPETASERDQLKKDNALLLEALETLRTAFIHDGNGKTKGNQAKTDVIKHNEDMRLALVKARETVDYKIGK